MWVAVVQSPGNHVHAAAIRFAALTKDRAATRSTDSSTHKVDMPAGTIEVSGRCVGIAWWSGVDGSASAEASRVKRRDGESRLQLKPWRGISTSSASLRVVGKPAVSQVCGVNG
jgi:hypothetical protein